ncbi:tetratricopeptide repeat protein [Qipengyuania seohaensis]|uniref:tetratricopeptide repeat protein n=1 Tax=Qipengyuania seohaensis TaxID=266951 RepID=UPI000C227287|nr:tetratricopeptide repeat protein [Qipengyuania seohaensis]
MISRPDLAIVLALLCAAVASCGGPAATIDDLVQLRSQVARGDAGAAQLTVDRLVESELERSTYAAYAGEAALLRGDLADARTWLADGKFDDRTASLGYRLLADLEMREENVAAAADALEQARMVAPDDPRVWVLIGRLRYSLGNHLAAFEAADRAMELGPTDVEALKFRGQLARDSEGMVPAVQWFEKAVGQAGSDRALQIEYAATLLDAGEPERAQSILAQFDDPYLKAVELARTGDFVAARQALELTEGARRDTAAARLLSAIIDVELGNFQSAAQELDQLGREQPSNHRIRDLLAFVLSQNGNEQEVIYRFSDQARGPGGSPWLRTLVGRAFEALDRREEAAIYLDLAAVDETVLGPLRGGEKQAGDEGIMRRDQVRAALSAGDIERGVDMARRMAEAYPESADAAALLGDALLARNDRVAAFRAYERAARVRRNWPLLLRMAAARERAEAARLVAAFAAANPLNAEAAALAADGYAAAGQWEDAARLLDRALGNGMRQVPWVLAARSVAARELGEGDGVDQLDWAIEAYETQRMSPPAIAALLAALPEEDVQLRSELAAKLRALSES